MVVTKLWSLGGSYVLAEWEGRNNLNEFVHLRCKRGTVELRAHPDHRPGMDDADDMVDLEEFDYMRGETPTYDQVREALVKRGHTLPDRDDGEREDIPDRPPFPGYEGPGNYVHDWNTGGCRRVSDGAEPLPRLGLRVGSFGEGNAAGAQGGPPAGDQDQEA